uniref:MD-2-related lipid-recognition domain-containing protein n=1 Tax=Trichuris muris TaxID=70415 RepID=A0A5S6QS52_TRIMR
MFAFAGFGATAVLSIVLMVDATNVSVAPSRDPVYLDCGRPDRLVIVKNVQVSPMPIVLPGVSKVLVHFNFTSDVPDNLDIDMRMEKLSSDGQWVAVPCMFNSFGSCNLRDVSTCAFTHGLLGCPITKGDYNITDDLLLPNLSDSLLAIIVGEYRVSMKIRESGDKEIACVNLWFAIEKGTGIPFQLED